jgi:hypothetical protein
MYVFQTEVICHILIKACVRRGNFDHFYSSVTNKWPSIVFEPEGSFQNGFSSLQGKNNTYALLMYVGAKANSA